MPTFANGAAWSTHETRVLPITWKNKLCHINIRVILHNLRLHRTRCALRIKANSVIVIYMASHVAHSNFAPKVPGGHFTDNWHAIRMPTWRCANAFVRLKNASKQLTAWPADQTLGPHCFCTYYSSASNGLPLHCYMTSVSFQYAYASISALSCYAIHLCSL